MQASTGRENDMCVCNGNGPMAQNLKRIMIITSVPIDKALRLVIDHSQDTKTQNDAVVASHEDDIRRSYDINHPTSLGKVQCHAWASPQTKFEVLVKTALKRCQTVY